MSTRARVLLTLLGAVAPLAPAAVARAQSFEGARLLGFGGAQRALAGGNDALFVNPAGLAMARAYTLEAGYIDDLRGSDRRFSGSVVDSQAGPVAGALAYTYFSRRPDGVPDGEDRVAGHRVDVGVAFPLTEDLALGTAARYLNYRVDGAGARRERGFSVDVGLGWRIAEGLQLGVVGHDLAAGDRPETPTTWGGGLGWAPGGGLSLEVDALHDPRAKAVVLGGAAGYVLADRVPLRLGVTRDGRTGAWVVSGGLGVQYEGLGLDVGYRQRVGAEGAAPDRDERLFAASLRLTVL
jgi:hypothetical protein